MLYQVSLDSFMRVSILGLEAPYRFPIRAHGINVSYAYPNDEELVSYDAVYASLERVHQAIDRILLDGNPKPPRGTDFIYSVCADGGAGTAGDVQVWIVKHLEGVLPQLCVAVCTESAQAQTVAIGELAFARESGFRVIDHLSFVDMSTGDIEKSFMEDDLVPVIGKTEPVSV